MGAGLALEFKLRYPEMYEDYRKRCALGSVKIGEPYLYSKYGNHLLIYNFPTKKHWRYPSKIEWIEAGLRHFKRNYVELGIKSIAFPKLGSKNGKLEWREVKEIMLAELADIELEIFICLDEDENATGTEAEMIKNIQFFVKDKKLSKIVKKIAPDQVKRFSHIQFYDNVSKKEYERLFRACYLKSISTGRSSSRQISIFD